VILARRTRVPAELRRAAKAFRRLPGVDVVWLAVREPRARDAVIRWADGATSDEGLGRRIEPGAGAGGTILQGGPPWVGAMGSTVEGELAEDECTFIAQEGLTAVLVAPVQAPGSGDSGPRVEGVAYLGSRDAPFDGTVLEQALRLGERIARPLRDSVRLQEAVQGWQRAWTDAVGAGIDAEHRLDIMASQLAADAKRVLRSGIGIVYQMDRPSGALHSVGVAGEVIPGQVIPCVQRGQVLPPGCGSAGRAAATRAVFIAHDYCNDVLVPPIMAEAVPALPRFTTLSAPLIADKEVIGAITVGRYVTLGAYGAEDVRAAAKLAKLAAPVLARAQRAIESARRRLGASELSRLAGSLTQSLSAEAVCRQLVDSVLSLVEGSSALVWEAEGREPTRDALLGGILSEPRDPIVGHVLEQVIRTRVAFWTPDLYNDPRLAVPGMQAPPAEAEDRAVLAVPVRVREALLAILTVSGKTGRAFTPADVELVRALADQAALGLANARAYQDLEVSRTELLRHEKLVAMGRLAAGLAHELRNPLQNIVALIAELRDRATAELRRHPDFEEHPEFLRRALAEAKRASGIVDRLLEYVRERKPTLEPVDVRDIVTEAVRLVADGARVRGQDICVMTADAPLHVHADPIMLRQVVLNVLANALDALEGSGRVDVELRREGRGFERDRVVVSVRDSGRGILAEHLPHVFDPFFTTKEVGKGVGLGLAICQSLVEQHRGRIQVMSSGPGQGTTVVFWLPAKS
jgi:signal transduction histidine kinase